MSQLPTTTDAVTIEMMKEGGGQRIPTDTGFGRLYRPFGVSDPGGRTAPLETLYDFFINDVPDPDSALASDPEIDEKLRQQPDVHACMRLRELTVASLPATIEPSEAHNVDKQFAEKVAAYVNDIFNQLPHRADLYRQMQNAVLMGGQGIEFVWANRNGVEQPIEYYPVHKTRFVFDRLGNMALLTRTTPVWGTYVSANPSRPQPKQVGQHMAWPTPPGKFVYHKYMAEGGPWHRPASEGYVYWGRGEDTALYIPVTFDQFVLRFRMKWLEKHGMPTMLLYYPASDEVTNQVIKIANSLRGESVVTIPRPSGQGTENNWYTIDTLDPPSSGIGAFTDFSENWTKPRIEKIILGGANLLEVGSTGSYAATMDQRDSGASIIFRYDALNIDQTLTQQLIPQIVWARWPDMPYEYMPKHKLAAEERDVMLDKLAVVREASSMAPIRQQEVYDITGFDRPDEKDEVIEGGGFTEEEDQQQQQQLPPEGANAAPAPMTAPSNRNNDNGNGSRRRRKPTVRQQRKKNRLSEQRIE